ncbi:MAG TPA: hypothetical protein VMF53_11735 [Alphaproteobacteria bacterium]|nr:hypothetical protein [Alphaproteobacteria bacterium]
MNERPKARIVVPVWGDYHTRKIFEPVALPALLAPGNLPCLAERFDCELVILTEARLVPFLEASRAIAEARRLARVAYRAIDDLLRVPNYSVPLTLALFRGIEDLGAAMTETFLFFLNADFILADGCYRTVVDRIAAGETLIFAPSLRASAESVLPRLAAARDRATGNIAISPRALVRLTLDHLHPMPAAKIVNRPFRHPRRIDQFYWAVGADALIGYQFPIALVCVKPERIAPKVPPSFFDYCAIPVLAPGARRCVLADSDDFFMMELQPRKTGRDQLRLGWPPLADIVADLDIWTTEEQRALGGELLTIHAGPASDISEEDRAPARRFNAALRARLSARPRSHLDHPFWLPAYAQYRALDRATAGVEAAQPGVGGWRASVFSVTATLSRLARAVAGSAPEYRIVHPLWLYYAEPAERIRACLEGDAFASTAVLPKGSIFARLFKDRPDVERIEFDPALEDSESPLATLALAEDARGRPRLLFVELPELNAAIAETLHRLATTCLPTGSVVLIYINLERGDGASADGSSIARDLAAIVPAHSTATLSFYGAPLAHLGKTLVERTIAAYHGGVPGAFFRYGLAAGLLMPVFLANNLLESRRYRGLSNRFSTRLLLAFDLRNP